ncbi:ABC transporter ATP-binding protein [Haloparvum sp. AD34]
MSDAAPSAGAAGTTDRDGDAAGDAVGTAGDDTPLLGVENLQTQFPTDRGVVKAVDGVDLTIESGEIVGLVGESGSGKSVLAESVAGIVEEPGEIVGGDVRLHGDSLVDKTEAELERVRGGQISMVFQDPMNSLNPTLSVGEQIAETVRLHQDVGESVSLSAEMKRKIVGAAKNGEAWRRAIEMLEAVEIPEPESRATDYPHQFSGGMRQRAMIAMALSCEPDLLVADEPTTALDVTIQAQILEELTGLKEEFDTSILLITHDLAVVAETCDRVNVMYAGEIVERAETEELFSNPQHPYTQGLIASTPRIDVEDQDLTPIEGNVPDLIDVPFACHFAPRCPEAERECFEIDPEFRDVGEDGTDHEAACLRRGPEGDRL